MSHLWNAACTTHATLLYPCHNCLHNMHIDKHELFSSPPDRILTYSLTERIAFSILERCQDFTR